MIPMQNTGQAFGNLGGQMTNAIEATKNAASIDLMNAQANKLNTEANTVLPAQVEQIKAQTGLSSAEAYQVMNNMDAIKNKIMSEASEARSRGDQADSQAALADVQAQLAGQNLRVLQATRDAIVSSANSDAQAKLYGLPLKQEQSVIQSSGLGHFTQWLDQILQPVGTAIGAAKGIQTFQ
jgi:hypothetical protein